MTDRRMSLDDHGLEAALRALSSEIDWPTSAPAAADGTPIGPDIATRVRARVASRERRPRRWWTYGGRPLRRGLVLALLALLALAIVAGAVGLGLPGLRITLGEPPASVLPSPTVTSSPTGSRPPSPSPDPPAHRRDALAARSAGRARGCRTRDGRPGPPPEGRTSGPPDRAWMDHAKGDQVRTSGSRSRTGPRPRSRVSAWS